MAIEFEWDEEKAEMNRKKHKVDFEEGESVFGDPFSITIDDPDHSKKEQRFIDIGTSATGNFWSLSTQNEKTKSKLSVVEKQQQLNVGNMKNNSNKRNKKIEEMRAEYDFSGGTRGKHADAYQHGHTVTIHKEDGTTIVQNFKLEEGAVILEPDVREYFPDAESVNNALRTLISIAPKARKSGYKHSSRSASSSS